MRKLYLFVFWFSYILIGFSLFCSKNPGPTEPTPDPCDLCDPKPCDPVPCDIVTVEGVWNIRVKHTTSAGDHYELRQMKEGVFVTIWEHTFTDAGSGEFFEFKEIGYYHPNNPIGVLVEKSRAEMFVWFEQL